MNPWVPLAGALTWNYLRHRNRKPTICSTWRHFIPKRLAYVLLFVGFVALVAHVLDGYDIKLDLDRLTD